MEIDQSQENNDSRNLQDPLQRKCYYRTLLNKAEEIQEADSVGLQTVTEVGQILREVNQLNLDVEFEERVGNADETLLDCLVLSSASGILKRCIETVDVFTSTYDPREFGDKILAHIQHDPENDEEPNPGMFALLLQEARNAIPRVAQFVNIYGSYDLNNLPRPKEKKERVKVVKEKLQKKQPEKVRNLEKEEEGIEETVKVLYDVLQEGYLDNDEQAISYYDYIIDTDSYGTTIENMFYFSFLIRDGKAHLELAILKNVEKPAKER
ncbi:non-structural maintenance of chromosomes element 4 homolog A isoform X2 [Anthonomus grandis grandis]|uniref:non-structural maintenance of chromosomes element 4 homolog A isoform X2 n=1 Tax=Anthonomus grandis grandis TaxID=2921223 RepID=UPI002165A0AE|nr:non-structural maintenance of chromosomes element 4 homolog A isoform X2 [Anthonomus grandis grandis]